MSDIIQKEGKIKMIDFIDYSKVMRPHDPPSENVRKLQEQWSKERELKEKEEKTKQALKKKNDEAEFIAPYKDHPINEEMIQQLKEIDPALRKRVKPVYILDTDLNIFDMVTSVERVGNWIRDNGYNPTAPGRTTIFEYMKSKRLYKDQLYFVESKKYEEFIENFK